jgi:Ca2+-transporting ATPase
MRSSFPLYKAGFFINKAMNLSVLICSAVQASVVVFEPIAKIFGVVPLNSVQWVTVILLSLLPLFSGEIGKLFSENKMQI